MPGIQKILHATDFSENSQYAFQTACALARDNHANLLVLHVMMPSVSPLMQEPPPDPLRVRRIPGISGAIALAPTVGPADSCGASVGRRRPRGRDPSLDRGSCAATSS